MTSRPARLTACLGVAVALSAPAIAAPAAAADSTYGPADFARVRKFDAHVHFNRAGQAAMDIARQDNFELLSINVDYPDFPPIDEQYRLAQQFRKTWPRRFHFAATFSMAGWGQAGWAQAVNARLAHQVASGAVAVKIWKNVGLTQRDAKGALVMLDDPGFDPVAAEIQALGVPLIDHQGEPKNCWLPMDQITTTDDREYFTEHPQYYMYAHPEMPSYETLMAVRDRFVERHPQLSFVGAHMASLEWSVDELSKFLDAHPNAVVDLAQRLPHVERQSALDYNKVRAFFLRYSDRLLYATDLTLQPTDDPASFARDADQVWRSDWTYLATAQSQHIASIDRDAVGLNLPRAVIDRIYWGNAHRVFTRLAHQGG